MILTCSEGFEGNFLLLLKMALEKKNLRFVSIELKARCANRKLPFDQNFLILNLVQGPSAHLMTRHGKQNAKYTDSNARLQCKAYLI